MRRLTTDEVLSLNRLLQMETTGLALAKATVGVIQDDQFKSLSQAGITAAEARIKGLQQFIMENDVIEAGEVQ